MIRLRSPFSFFPGNPEYEAEFRQSYQDQGASLVTIGSGVAGILFLGFWLLDGLTISLGFFGGVQTIRLIAFLALSVMCGMSILKRQLIIRYYDLIANLVFGLGIQAAIYVAYASRLGGSVQEIYWAITSSTATAIVVGFGASKLHSTNSFLLTVAGYGAAVFYALNAPGHGNAYIGRLLMHVTMTLLACYFLRRAVESREVQLFLSMKEQLKSERYTRELEEARSEAERARQAAEAADKAKSNFLAGMSHEIRTPIHGLLNLTELAQREASPDGKRMLGVAAMSLKSLLSILNGVLDYSATSSGKAKFDIEPVDVLEMLRTVEQLHMASAQSKGIRLQMQHAIEPERRFIMHNQVRLTEVLNNLVSNAIKFTDSGAVDITANASGYGEQVQLDILIKDTGIGMSKGDLAMLGTAFWQSDQSLSRKRGGTGLGVALAKEILAHLNGSLEIESIEGLGTKVTIRVLAKKAPAAFAEAAALVNGQRLTSQTIATIGNGPGRSSPATAKPTDVPPGKAKPFTGDVLLVEDNHLNALLACTHLAELGLRVEVAADGVEALRHLEGRDFDLILMDVQMPMMDGLEATRQIRALEAANPRRGHTPIIAWTAHQESTDLVRCKEAGMDDFLEKPYEPEMLADRLRNWLTATSISRSQWRAA